MQEVPSSATEVGRPEQALNTRRSAAGGVTAARAASPHLARPFDLTAHAESSALPRAHGYADQRIRMHGSRDCQLDLAPRPRHPAAESERYWRGQIADSCAIVCPATDVVMYAREPAIWEARRSRACRYRVVRSHGPTQASHTLISDFNQQIGSIRRWMVNEALSA